MQISSIQSNPYITATTSSNKNNTNSDKTIDYTTLSIDKLEKLSYEETRAHANEIETNLRTNYYDADLSKNDFLKLSDYQQLFGIARYPTNNDVFDKSLYNTYQSIDPSNRFLFSVEMQQNLSDYSQGKKVQASFMVGEGIHSSENLTIQQRNNINFDDFLSTMISNFGNDVATSGGSVKQQYQGIVDGYSLLKQNYDFQKSEPIYA